MCAEDFRPFHIVGCGGFHKMLQFVLDVGVQSKLRMDINGLLTNEKTVKRAADASKVEVEKLLLQLSAGIFRTNLALVRQLTCTRTRTPASTTTASLTLIDSNWIMSAQTLGCIEFPNNMAHTGVNILTMFNQML